MHRGKLREFLSSRSDGFNEAQQRAIETLGRPTAITAAAGSGKTSVLVERYLHLLARGMEPHQILLLTFTNEAADQMRRRILKLLPASEDLSELVSRTETTPNIGTLHAFCYRIVDQYFSYLNRTRLIAIPSEMETVVLFENAFNRWKQDLLPEKVNLILDHYPFSQWRAIAKRLVRERHLLMSKKQGFAKEAWLNEVLALFYPLLESLDREKNERGWYQFDDLEYFALKILRDFPEVAARISDPIRAVMVDEFQDTSREQWDVIEAILKGRYEQLFFVGDPKQSIYRFRKAEVKIFEEATARVELSGGAKIDLMTNYRTGPTLLGNINQLCGKLFSQNETSENNISMSSGLEEGTVASLMEVIRVAGDRREFAANETVAIIQKVKELIQGGSEPGEIALLFRSADRIDEVARALEQQKIDTIRRTGATLFDNYEVVDLCSFLRSVANPLDDFNLAAFLRSGYVNWGRADLWSAFKSKKEQRVSLFEILQQTSPPDLKWFIELIELGETEIPALLEYLFESKAIEMGSAARLFVSALLQCDSSLLDCLSRMEAWERDEIRISDPGLSVDSTKTGVRLMTVHAAKGLEFETVFLADLIRGLPTSHSLFLFDAAPKEKGLESAQGIGARYLSGAEWAETDTYQKLWQREKMEEEKESKRILYVALTRAKLRLFLLLPNNFSGIASASWAKQLEAAL